MEIFLNVCLWRRSYAQNWQILTLKNCYGIEPPSYASAAYVVASYGPRFFSTVKKFGQLARIFWANGLPPPWQKIACTPMHINTRMLCPLIFKFFWQTIQKVIHTNSSTFPYGLFYGNVQFCLHRKRKLKLINFSHK